MDKAIKNLHTDKKEPDKKFEARLRRWIRDHLVAVGGLK
jgi:hypothetical protein